MKKWGQVVIFFIVTFFVSQPILSAPQKIYTIQVATYDNLKDAETQYQKLNDLLSANQKDALRIEKIKGFYVIRIGRFTTPSKASSLLKKIKIYYSDAFVRSAYYIKGRIMRIYQSSQETSISQKTKQKKKSPPLQQTEKKKTPASEKTLTVSSNTPKRSSLTVFFILTGIFVVLVLGYFQGQKIKHYYRFLLRPRIPLLYRAETHEFPLFLSNPRDRALRLKKKVHEIVAPVKIDKLQLPHKIKISGIDDENILWITNVPLKNILKGPHILYFLSDTTLQEEGKFLSIVVSRDRVIVKNRVILRGIISDGEIQLYRDSGILQLIDSEKKLSADEMVDLGEYATCTGEMYLSKGVSFRCIYALPIVTYNNSPIEVSLSSEELKEFNPKNIQPPVQVNTKTIQSPNGPLNLPPKTKIEKNLIVARSLTVGRNCLINGNIKAGQQIVFSEGLVVNGNISSNKEVIIGKNTIIYGDSISARDRIVIKPGVRIGTKERPCSIRCDGEVIISENVEIYGSIASMKGSIV